MKIGDKLYRRVKNQITEYEVKKIGRKWLTVQSEYETFEVNKENLKYENKNFSHRNIQFYLTREEIEQLILTEEARYVLKAMLDINKLSLEQINSIIEIIRK